MISLFPQSSGLKAYQSTTTPVSPKKGERWVYPISGEELTYYVDSSGIGAFVEFSDGAYWEALNSATDSIILPSSPSIGQVLTHGKRKWQWNGKFWKSMYDYVSVRGGTFSD